jgi:hypothetical protein
VTAFDGFPPAGLALLRGLPERDAAWFKANKREYQLGVAEPAKAFVVALGARLNEVISPDLAAVPKTNGSIAPINNDVRFSAGGPTYKDHLLFRFWEGSDKKTAPTLFVRVSGTEAGFATGAGFASVDRWRALISDDATGAALADAIARLTAGHPVEIAGPSLKRVPSPNPGDHPRADLLKLKGFQARWPEPAPPSITGPGFVDWCAGHLLATGEIHRWLVDNLAA